MNLLQTEIFPNKQNVKGLKSEANVTSEKDHFKPPKNDEKKSIIQEARNLPILDIARVLGIEYDANKKAMCFTGHDTTASLSFNVEKNYFKCFGCGIAGSGIDLVMKTKAMSFPDAIDWLENHFQLRQETVDSITSHKQASCEHPSSKEELSEEQLEIRSALYSHLLQLCDEEEAVQYLKRRGIDRKITIQRGIRVAPRGVERKLLEKYSHEDLIHAGIMAISRRTKRPYFTFFNHRLIIPYRDRNGTTITNLQGRNIDDEREPKYRFLSGIETTPYNLEALDQGEMLYLCEGVLDALSCMQLELEHPIAFPGVQSFKTTYHDLLFPYRLVVASDNDNAGQAFYLKLRKQFRAIGKDVYKLNWNLLKATCGVNSEVKDINDIVRLMDHELYKRNHPSPIFSHLVEDMYILDPEGELEFSKGVFYNKEEVALIIKKKCPPEDLGVIHLIKDLFHGTIIS
jgi:DNA primase catalytic core